MELTLSDLEKMEEFENIVFKNMNKFADFIRKIINSDRYDIILEIMKKMEIMWVW